MTGASFYLEWFDNETEFLAGDYELLGFTEDQVRDLLNLPASESVSGVTFPVTESMLEKLADDLKISVNPKDFSYHLTLRAW